MTALDTWVSWLPTTAASLSLLQLPCMSWASRALSWDSELDTLSPLTRKIVLLFGTGIALSVSGLAVVVIAGHGELARSRFGLTLAAFLACFWCARAWAQLSWLAPEWRARLPALHRLLAMLYPSIALSYLVFAILASRGVD